MKQLWQKFIAGWDGKKTVTYAGLNIILPLLPGIGPKLQAWIALHPMEYAQLNGAIVAILRSMTKGPIKKVEGSSDKEE